MFVIRCFLDLLHPCLSQQGVAWVGGVCAQIKEAGEKKKLYTTSGFVGVILLRVCFWSQIVLVLHRFDRKFYDYYLPIGIYFTKYNNIRSSVKSVMCKGNTYYERVRAIGK